MNEYVEKVVRLRALGIEPFPPAAFRPTHSAAVVQHEAGELIDAGSIVRIAGRVIGRRRMGQVAFVDLLDDGSRIQVFIERSAIGEAAWTLVEFIDLGDFLGISGSMFRTRVGELTVRATAVTILGKPSAHVPLPKFKDEDRIYATTSTEQRYRDRHLDLLANPASREVFVQRSAIVSGIRRYLDGAGFIEVETPVLGPYYSGAAARPFKTHLNARDFSMFLRVSPECYLKRLLVGGLNKVYEIGKNFRNEGLSARHNPEFTMVEWYEAYSDYFHQMERFETLVAGLCAQVNGATRIEYRGRELDLTPPWPRLPMAEAVSRTLGADVTAMDEVELRAASCRLGSGLERSEAAGRSWGELVVQLFEAHCESTLWQPVFITDHPVEISPLTKRHRRDARLVERFEPFIAGMEVGNSYSELNDGFEQRQRLETQRDGDAAYDLDVDFLHAMDHGMPQAGGTGMGVDRVTMILTGAESIRDVILFPFYAPDRGPRLPNTGASCQDPAGQASSTKEA